MQTANRGLTIKQYQPAIQPISVTPAATIQPIATVVTGSNVKDDYESESTFLFFFFDIFLLIASLTF
jgi:hypothetical protein